jgi:hypothetical protein
MTEHGHGQAPAAGTDREIDARRIVEIAIWLAGTTIGAFVIAWLIYLALAGEAKREDPRPSPLAAAREQRLPPGPQLQVRPERDLAAYRAAEKARLDGWGWVDEGAGVAHIPVERAIDLYAAQAAATAPATAPATN